ncbi:hypothetical protein IWQ60_004132 [Tieghemiomyces parasiticus]|uniref:HMG box domain-containing protein n=1 Tax=Tieghemiomyces parasiticus TaxID=78921 RepID=A0A9W8ABJ3_9FUNG|nr:hypothetical protein IWQ60_004132 [Tieghemiomyces parasiticus]
MNGFPDTRDGFGMLGLPHAEGYSGMVMASVSNGSSSTASPTSQVSFSLTDPHTPNKNEEKSKRKYKRFRNSFIYFVNDRRKRRTTAELAIGHRGFISRMGEEWKHLSEDERKPFIELAEEDRKRYEEDVKKFGKIPAQPPKDPSNSQPSHPSSQAQRHGHHLHHPHHLHPHARHHPSSHLAHQHHSSPETGGDGVDYVLDPNLTPHMASFAMYGGMASVNPMSGYPLPNPYMKMVSANGLSVMGGMSRPPFPTAHPGYPQDPSQYHHYRSTVTNGIPVWPYGAASGSPAFDLNNDPQRTTVYAQQAAVSAGITQGTALEPAKLEPSTYRAQAPAGLNVQPPVYSHYPVQQTAPGYPTTGYDSKLTNDELGGLDTKNTGLYGPSPTATAVSDDNNGFGRSYGMYGAAVSSSSSTPSNSLYPTYHQGTGYMTNPTTAGHSVSSSFNRHDSDSSSDQHPVYMTNNDALTATGPGNGQALPALAWTDGSQASFHLANSARTPNNGEIEQLDVFLHNGNGSNLSTI